MTTEARPQAAIAFPAATLVRARVALSCLPFNLRLFAQMRDLSVPLSKIAGESGVKEGYATKPMSELEAENHLVWLINVGLLRREVDGQGLTDSFRLTPLGRQLVAQWERDGSLPEPSPWQRYRKWADRRLRLPLLG